MMTGDNFASILGAMAWPLTVLLVVLLLKDDISRLLKRVEKAKLPGGEFSFYGEAFIDKLREAPSVARGAEPVAAAEQPEAKPIKWENTGNLFWAGRDLMSTIDVLLRGAPREIIVSGLRQSLHHVRSLGFTSTPIESRLAKLKTSAESMLEADWAPVAVRNDYARDLASLIRAIGDLAEANQPGFDPNPKQ